jgi:CheY-like chemotaxis protein
MSSAPQDEASVRALVCDGDAVLRSAVSKLVEQRGGWVIAEADRSFDAITLVDRFDPNLVVLDTSLAGGSALEVVDHLRLHQPGAQVIVFTAFYEQMREFARPGVRVVPKPDLLDLERALDAAWRDLESVRPDTERRRPTRSLPAASLRGESGLDDAAGFYRVLGEADVGDALVAFDGGGVDAAPLVRIVRQAVRTQDQLIVRGGAILLLLIGGSEAVASVLQRVRTSDPVLAETARVHVISPDDEPGAALDAVSPRA